LVVAVVGVVVIMAVLAVQDQRFFQESQVTTAVTLLVLDFLVLHSQLRHQLHCLHYSQLIRNDQHLPHLLFQHISQRHRRLVLCLAITFLSIVILELLLPQCGVEVAVGWMHSELLAVMVLFLDFMVVLGVVL